VLTTNKTVPYINYIALNFKNPALQDIRVRKAINMAIDREGIAKEIKHGTSRAEYGLLSPGIDAYDPNFKSYGYDPEGAKKLLAEAGVRYVLPNVFSPVVVYATTLMGLMIVVGSGLSFLGLGVQPPTADWGAMVAEGRVVLRRAPHVTILPGCAILVVSLAFNFLGDGVRDALDPRTTTILANTNERAISKVVAWITGRSRAVMLSYSSDPSPGHAKTTSVSSAPPSRYPSCRPVMVMTGGRAFKMTCRHMSAARVNPLDLATRTCGPSITVERTILAMMAAGPSAVVTVGRTRWRRRSNAPPSPAMSCMPETGSQRSWMAKRRTRIKPSQNGGALPANRAIDMLVRSNSERARKAAKRPTE
jgi:hypothetical protein